MRKASKVTSIRIDPKLWKRAKFVAIEEGITLSALIQEALDIVVGWREIIGESQTAIIVFRKINAN